MNRNGKDIQTNRGTVEEGSLPGFLGNEGKSKEVSSVFAAILEGGLHQGNESQGTVQNHWLATINANLSGIDSLLGLSCCCWLRDLVRFL